MSFTQMKRDELYELAVNNFAVDVDERANKAQIIAALAENGVTWDMAKTFDQNAAAIEEDLLETVEPSPAANVVTAASSNPAPEFVSVDPVLEENAAEPASTVDFAGIERFFVLVPRGVDGYVKDNVFHPGEPVDVSTPGQRGGGVVLVKMERANPRYDVRGYTFTSNNPFALVKEHEVDAILSHDGFKIASPSEAQEFYG